MPWVRFIGRFEWRPHPSQVVVYPPAATCLVTRRCAAEAVAAGKAEAVMRPVSKDEP